MEKRKSTGLLLSILGVISLILITAGVTYAFFSYTKEGTKTSTIETGSIAFRYNEVSNSITLTNPSPMTDAAGKTDTGTNGFQFTITSTTPSTATIPYVITLRDVTDTTSATEFDGSQVKVYLDTAATGTNYTIDTTNSNAVRTYAELSSQAVQPTIQWFDNIKGSLYASNDVVAFQGEVPANQANNAYSQTFKLGLWLNGGASGDDYSAYEFVKIDEANTAAGASVDTLRGTTFTDQTTSYTGKKLLTSTEYYALSTAERALYTRIAFVNYTDRKIIEKMETSQAGSAGNGWVADEQYYPFNGGSFSVRVNVYAQGATVSG